jgi:hypothetical protein
VNDATRDYVTGAPEMAEGGCDQKAGGDTAAIFIRYASQDVGIGNAVCAPSRMRTTLAGIVATFGHALQRKFRKGVAFLVALIIAAGAAVAAAASNEPIEYLDQARRSQPWVGRSSFSVTVLIFPVRLKTTSRSLRPP